MPYNNMGPPPVSTAGPWGQPAQPQFNDPRLAQMQALQQRGMGQALGQMGQAYPGMQSPMAQLAGGGPMGVNRWGGLPTNHVNAPIPPQMPPNVPRGTMPMGPQNQVAPQQTRNNAQMMAQALMQRR